MPTTLEDLPGPAHDTIASMLPDGDGWLPNRRLLALVSRSMLHHHGGTLASLHVHWSDQNQVAALTTLLQRHRNLKGVYVDEPEALPSLAVVLAQGCLCNIKYLDLSFQNGRAVHLDKIRSLADAM